jgi:hypothetical protein
MRLEVAIMASNLLWREEAILCLAVLLVVACGHGKTNCAYGSAVMFSKLVEQGVGRVRPRVEV